MKLLYTITLIILLTSCSEVPKTKEDNKIWSVFQTKIIEKDFQYLIKNSLDSIKCVNCINSNNDEYYPSILIFTNYLDKLYNKEFLTDRCYSAFQDSNRIRISYSDDKKLIGEEISTTIYLFDKHNGNYVFTGMITTP